MPTLPCTVLYYMPVGHFSSTRVIILHHFIQFCYTYEDSNFMPCFRTHQKLFDSNAPARVRPATSKIQKNPLYATETTTYECGNILVLYKHKSSTKILKITPTSPTLPLYHLFYTLSVACSPAESMSLENTNHRSGFVGVSAIRSLVNS